MIDRVGIRRVDGVVLVGGLMIHCGQGDSGFVITIVGAVVVVIGGISIIVVVFVVVIVFVDGDRGG